MASSIYYLKSSIPFSKFTTELSKDYKCYYKKVIKSLVAAMSSAAESIKS